MKMVATGIDVDVDKVWKVLKDVWHHAELVAIIIKQLLHQLKLLVYSLWEKVQEVRWSSSSWRWRVSIVSSLLWGSLLLARSLRLWPWSPLSLSLSTLIVSTVHISRRFSLPSHLCSFSIYFFPLPPNLWAVIVPLTSLPFLLLMINMISAYILHSNLSLYFFIIRSRRFSFSLLSFFSSGLLHFESDFFFSFGWDFLFFFFIELMWILWCRPFFWFFKIYLFSLIFRKDLMGFIRLCNGDSFLFLKSQRLRY